jgi:sugar/nucleoside kinase (ribokinase family)
MPKTTRSTSVTPQVVTFGMIVPATLLIVDKMPELNSGSEFDSVTEYISDDAAIVALELSDWDVRAGLIGTTLGNDAAGRRTVRRLKERGVLGHIRMTSKFATPYELVISDAHGNRTYYWKKEPHVLATLGTADLSMIEGSKLLYVDWYDGLGVCRALDEARRLGVPTFVNVEHGHDEQWVLDELVSGTTVCQAVTSATQAGGDPEAVVASLHAAGARTVIVTLGSEGCLVSSNGERLRVHAPRVDVVDVCGAGATLSSGFILGHLRGWSLEESARFAVAAASLECTVVGPKAFPIGDVRRMAGGLRVERTHGD